MDFMMQLPEWNGMDAILVLINQFSKLAKMAPNQLPNKKGHWGVEPILQKLCEGQSKRLGRTSTLGGVLLQLYNTQ
jgi:hypothetical protein